MPRDKEGHHWSLYRFVKNDMSMREVALGAQFHDGPHGLGIGAFDAVHDEIGGPGGPGGPGALTVVASSSRLDAESFIMLLAGEMMAYAAKRGEVND